MRALRKFEVEVIRLLAESSLSKEQLDDFRDRHVVLGTPEVNYVNPAND